MRTYQYTMHIASGALFPPAPPRESGRPETDSEEFKVQLKVEKTAALTKSLDHLKTGIDEAKVCIYTSLRVQVSLLRWANLQYMY